MAAIPRGFSYETLALGQRSTSRGRTITEADHGLFMMLTGAWHPIHADEEYAKTTPLGRRIVQGTLGIALALGNLEAELLESSDPLVAALGIESWAYRGPIFLGDTLHIDLEIVGRELTKSGERYVVSRRIWLINQQGKTVQEGIVRSLFQRRKVTLDASAGSDGVQIEEVTAEAREPTDARG
jgi:acyl dehydratase